MGSEDFIERASESARLLMDEIYADTTPAARHETLGEIKRTALEVGKDAHKQFPGDPFKILFANIGELYANVVTLAYLVDALQDQVNRLEERLAE